MITLSSVPAAQAAGGDLDSTFGTGGKVTTDLSDTDYGNATAVQPDGKIIVVGEASNDFGLARYNSDGSLDTSFDSDGKVITDLGDSAQANAVALQADGKIVVAGTSGNDFAVVRYNSDGSLDTSFDTDGLVTTDFDGLSGSYSSAIGNAVAIQTDGKIVVVGHVNNGGQFNDFAVVRYNSDGSLDTSGFNSAGSLPPGAAGIVTTSILANQEDRAYAVAIQTDGKIVVVGESKSQFAMVRYNSDGTLDTTFDSDGKVFAASPKVATGYALALQPDGKIVVTGATYVIDNASTNCIDSSGKHCEYLDFWLARYNADGSPDASFGTVGELSTAVNSRGNDDQGRGVAIQTDGKIVVAGYSDVSIHTYTNGGNDESFNRSNDFAVGHYNSDGSLDTTFDSDGKVTTDFSTDGDDEGRAVVIQADGKIVVTGTSNKTGSRDFVLARYEGDPISSNLVYLPLIIK